MYIEPWLFNVIARTGNDTSICHYWIKSPFRPWHEACLKSLYGKKEEDTPSTSITGGLRASVRCGIFEFRCGRGYFVTSEFKPKANGDFRPPRQRGDQ